MKKIVLVNQVTGPMFIDLANHFVRNGYDVSLITGVIEKTGSALDPGAKVILRTVYKRNNPITRILTWVLFTIQVYGRLKRESDKACIMLTSNPPFLPLLAHFLSKKSDLEFRILIYDVYPDVLENAGLLSKKRFISRRWRHLNENAFAASDKLYTISDGMKAVLAQYAPPDRWEVIYPWVDVSFIKPLPKQSNPFLEKYDLIDKTVILYSGNMGATHDLMTVLGVANRLKEEVRFHFVLIGDGSEKRRLKDYAAEHGLQNVIFLPFQQPEMLPYSIPAADFGIVTLSGEASQLSVPSKVFYQMAAGNAVICIANANSELAQLVSKNDCGVVFAPGDITGIADFLLNVAVGSARRWGMNSRATSEKFSPKNVAKFDI